MAAENLHLGWKKIKVREDPEDGIYTFKFKDTTRYGYDAPITTVTFPLVITQRWNKVPEIYFALITPVHKDVGLSYNYAVMLIVGKLRIVYPVIEVNNEYMVSELDKLYPLVDEDGNFIYTFEPDTLFIGTTIQKQVTELVEYIELFNNDDY